MKKENHGDQWLTALMQAQMEKSTGLNRARIFKEARTMMEATAETLGLDANIPAQFKDDLQRIDRTMEQQLGVAQRDLVTP